jgi:hypothetical protein
MHSNLFDVASSFYYLEMINRQVHSMCAILYLKYILLSNGFHHVTCVLPKPWMPLAHEHNVSKTLKNCCCTYQKKSILLCKIATIRGSEEETHPPSFFSTNKSHQSKNGEPAPPLSSLPIQHSVPPVFRHRPSAGVLDKSILPISRAPRPRPRARPPPPSLPLDPRNSLSIFSFTDLLVPVEGEEAPRCRGLGPSRAVG